MKTPDERYVDYLRWAIKNELPVLDPIQYEKALNTIPSNPNNIDAILRNNHKKKDR